MPTEVTSHWRRCQVQAVQGEVSREDEGIWHLLTRCLCLLQKFLCVADLARKDKRVLRKKYQIYFW